MNAIEVSNLTKYYQKSSKPSLDKASFIVKEGDWHGFIGRNGAGKTTTIKTLIGAIKQTSGKASIFGHSSGSIESSKLIGYVPEKTSFEKGKFESTTRYLTDIALMNGLTLKQAKIKVDQVAKELSIGKEFMKKNPYNFSSGEKRRILVAQALLGDPKVLILDEPTANLDPDSRKFVLDILKDLSNKRSITILISSHVLTELQKYVTGWTILEEGRVLENKSQVEKEINAFSEFQVSSNEVEKVFSYLKSKGYNSLKKYESSGMVIVKIDNELQSKKKLQKVIGSSSINVNFFGEKILNLEERYELIVEDGK